MSKLLSKEELMKWRCAAHVAPLLDHIDALDAEIQAREVKIRSAADIIGKLALELREYKMKEQFNLAHAKE